MTFHCFSPSFEIHLVTVQCKHNVLIGTVRQWIKNAQPSYGCFWHCSPMETDKNTLNRNIHFFNCFAERESERMEKKLKQQPSRKATFVYSICNAFIISVISSKYGFEPAAFQVYTQLGPVSTVIHQTNIRFNNAPVFSLKFSSSADLRPWDKILFHKIVHKVPQIYHWIRNSAKRCNHFSCNLKCRQIFE